MTTLKALLLVLALFWVGALGACFLSCLCDGLVRVWRKLT